MIDPILIEGLPGTGKTTLICRLAEHWGHARCIGFFTSERRERGRRTGFDWQNFDGRKGILADLQAGQPRIGKYRVDLSSFEQAFAGLSIIPPGKILMIDEVGKMECLSAGFRNTLSVWEQLQGPRIFTVPTHGTSLIELFKSRNRAGLIRLTIQNRDDLFKRIMGMNL